MDTMVVIVAVVLILMSVPAIAQDTLWRWASDSWVGQDKLGHIGRDGLFFTLLYSLNHNFAASAIGTLVMSFSWEYKDGLVRWEEYGWWGGDGFSYKDILVGFIGPLMVYGLIKLLG